MSCWPTAVHDGGEKVVCVYKNTEKDFVCKKLYAKEICAEGPVAVDGEPVATNNHNYVVVGPVPDELPNGRRIETTSGHITATDGGAGNSITLSLPNTGVTAGS